MHNKCAALGKITRSVPNFPVSAGLCLYEVMCEFR